MRPKKVARVRRLVEALEQRMCLAVLVELDSGLLAVTGDAAGAIDVNVVEVGVAPDVALHLQVSESGLPVDSFPLADVTSGLQLQLEGTGVDANDTVSVDLAGQTLPRISADLGEGDNSFTLSNANISGSVSVRGNDGADTVLVNDTVDIGGLLSLSLGGGNNDIQILGDARLVFVRAGSGNDTLAVDAEAVIDAVFANLGHGDNSVDIQTNVSGAVHVTGGSGADEIDVAGAGHLFANLGSGVNDLTLAGDIDRSAVIHAHGAGTDTVTISGNVGGNAVVSLGGGANTLNVTGDIGHNLVYHGGQGDDSVTLGEDVLIEGNVVAHLGGGINNFIGQATVVRSVLVVTTNAADSTRVTVDDSKVGGQTTIRTGRPKIKDLIERLAGFFNN